MKIRNLILVIILFITVAIALPAYASSLSVGDTVQVQWKGKWYPSTIKQVKDGKYYIHYKGWGNNWDEWVGLDRIRTKSFSVGEKVRVKWKNKWWSADILKISNGKYYIHYDGYASSWDEWVGPARIRKK